MLPGYDLGQCRFGYHHKKIIFLLQRYDFIFYKQINLYQSEGISLPPCSFPRPLNSKNACKHTSTGIFYHVIPERLERSTYSLEGCCSIQLSYGTSLAPTSKCHKIKGFIRFLQSGGTVPDGLLLSALRPLFNPHIQDLPNKHRMEYLIVPVGTFYRIDNRSGRQWLLHQFATLDHHPRLIESFGS